MFELQFLLCILHSLSYVFPSEAQIGSLTSGHSSSQIVHLPSCLLKKRSTSYKTIVIYSKTLIFFFTFSTFSILVRSKHCCFLSKQKLLYVLPFEPQTSFNSREQLISEHSEMKNLNPEFKNNLLTKYILMSICKTYLSILKFYEKKN